MTETDLAALNHQVFACQYTHCQMHHMGLLRVYADCPVCLELHRLAETGRAWSAETATPPQRRSAHAR
jgi:hypothetical protein